MQERFYRRALTSESGLVSKMQENISGMKVIKAFVKEDKGIKEVQKMAEDVKKDYINTIAMSTSGNCVVYFMRVLGTALILWFGAQMVITGEMTIGTLVAFTEYQFAYFRPITELLTVYDQYQGAMAALERMFDLIDTGVEVEEISPDKAVKIDAINSVEFRDVTFGYDENIPVIKNISFTIGPNRKLAIVGPTWCRKSTIINLLSRFYDPLNGEILVNDVDIKRIPLYFSTRTNEYCPSGLLPLSHER